MVVLIDLVTIELFPAEPVSNRYPANGKLINVHAGYCWEEEDEEPAEQCYYFSFKFLKMFESLLVFVSKISKITEVYSK